MTCKQECSGFEPMPAVTAKHTSAEYWGIMRNNLREGDFCQEKLWARNTVIHVIALKIAEFLEIFISAFEKFLWIYDHKEWLVFPGSRLA